MIKLKRRFDYRTRLRPNAIAIVDPSTRSVLYPGKKPEETTSDAADKPQDTGAQKVEEESENGQMQQFNQPNIQQRYSFRKLNIKVETYASQGLTKLLISECNYLQNGVMTSQGLAPAYPFYMFEQHPVSYYDLPFYSHQ